MTTDDKDRSAPVVWLLTDNKPGHRNQLKGLGNRLRVLAGASLHWLSAKELKVPLWRALLARPPKLPSELPRPDLILAAGTATHRLLLSVRRIKGARTLVIMKPSFPLRWVSGALIPAHDGVSASQNVFVSHGVINAITPLARIAHKPEALVLVGGPCPHFSWDNDAVLAQIHHLMGQYPDWRWTISGSRRTPTPLRDSLQQLAGLKVTVVDPERTHDSWLSHQLAASRAVWVTPDSMSMVCEAATSGVPTGLFELPARERSRVAAGIRQLCEQGYVAPWTDHATVMAGQTSTTPTLWEANRAAQWVIRRWLADHRFSE